MCDQTFCELVQKMQEFKAGIVPAKICIKVTFSPPICHTAKSDHLNELTVIRSDDQKEKNIRCHCQRSVKLLGSVFICVLQFRLLFYSRCFRV